MDFEQWLISEGYDTAQAARLNHLAQQAYDDDADDADDIAVAQRLYSDWEDL